MSFKKTFTASTTALFLIAHASGYAHTTYTGYSGATGSKGTCASSCHGVAGGTLTVSGFPSSYVPGATYSVAIKHNGGSAIRQFNGSCRVGTTATNAGVIAAGANTAVYNTTGETNGIHLATASLDSAFFSWTAPASGTGSVKLYIAGLQGTSSNNPNTALTLTAAEAVTGITQKINRPANPISYLHISGSNKNVVLLPGFWAEAGPVAVRIFNLNGQAIESVVLYSSHGDLYWNGRNGMLFNPGTYLLELNQAGHTTVAKVMLFR